MKKLLMTSLVLAVAASVGCQGQQKELAQVPPPAPQPEMADTGTFEPVQVEAAQPAPVEMYQAPAPVQMAADPVPMGGTTYTIQKGDTLYSIARRHYGSGQRWQDIVAANPGLNPQKLAVGQTITLP